MRRDSHVCCLELSGGNAGTKCNKTQTNTAVLSTQPPNLLVVSKIASSVIIAIVILVPYIFRRWAINHEPALSSFILSVTLIFIVPQIRPSFFSPFGAKGTYLCFEVFFFSSVLHICGKGKTVPFKVQAEMKL